MFDVQLSSSEIITLAGVAVAGISASAAVVSAIWAVASARGARTAEEKTHSYQAVAEQQVRRATQAAEEAVTAQRRSADAAQRAADALEKQNKVADELQDAAEGVPWRVTYRHGHLWELYNDSDFPKFNVKVAGGGVVEIRSSELGRIDGRSSKEFWGATHSGSTSEVIVTWHRRQDDDGEPRTWTGTMPPSP